MFVVVVVFIVFVNVIFVVVIDDDVVVVVDPRNLPLRLVKIGSVLAEILLTLRS